MSLYHVTAERSGKWWTLQALEAPGALSQVLRLSDADQIREAIAFVTGEAEDVITIAVQVAMPEPAARHLAEASRLRAESDLARSRAAEESRAAARSLRDDGLTVREVGLVLGISHQRAAQLLADTQRLAS